MVSLMLFIYSVCFDPASLLLELHHWHCYKITLLKQNKNEFFFLCFSKSLILTKAAFEKKKNANSIIL